MKNSHRLVPSQAEETWGAAFQLSGIWNAHCNSKRVGAFRLLWSNERSALQGLRACHWKGQGNTNLLVFSWECGNEPGILLKESTSRMGVLGGIPFLIPCLSHQQGHHALPPPQRWMCSSGFPVNTKSTIWRSPPPLNAFRPKNKQAMCPNDQATNIPCAPPLKTRPDRGANMGSRRISWPGPPQPGGEDLPHRLAGRAEGAPRGWDRLARGPRARFLSFEGTHLLGLREPLFFFGGGASNRKAKGEPPIWVSPEKKSHPFVLIVFLFFCFLFFLKGDQAATEHCGDVPIFHHAEVPSAMTCPCLLSPEF